MNIQKKSHNNIGTKKEEARRDNKRTDKSGIKLGAKLENRKSKASGGKAG